MSALLLGSPGLARAGEQLAGTAAQWARTALAEAGSAASLALEHPGPTALRAAATLGRGALWVGALAFLKSDGGDRPPARPQVAPRHVDPLLDEPPPRYPFVQVLGADQKGFVRAPAEQDPDRAVASGPRRQVTETALSAYLAQLPAGRAPLYRHGKKWQSSMDFVKFAVQQKLLLPGDVIEHLKLPGRLTQSPNVVRDGLNLLREAGVLEPGDGPYRLAADAWDQLQRMPPWR